MKFSGTGVDLGGSLKLKGLQIFEKSEIDGLEQELKLKELFIARLNPRKIYNL